jgi:hypothetical protein
VKSLLSDAKGLDVELLEALVVELLAALLAEVPAEVTVLYEISLIVIFYFLSSNRSYCYVDMMNLSLACCSIWHPCPNEILVKSIYVSAVEQFVCFERLGVGNAERIRDFNVHIFPSV